MGKPSLAIYGPKFPDHSGVVQYIELYLNTLNPHFNCIHISNKDWQPPDQFDYVLYHLGNNWVYDGAFKALKLRPGPAIIHEHNCLAFYYQRYWEGITSSEEAAALVRLFSRRYHRQFPDRHSFFSFIGEQFKKEEALKQMSIDLGIERIFLKNVTVAFSHSMYYTKWLKRRYPFLRTTYLPFAVEAFDRGAAQKVREELGLESTDFLFGTYGYINKHKRVDKIIAAWHAWETKPPNAKLLVFGKNLTGEIIPVTKDILYLDYTEETNRFDAHLAAANCVIQLRYPSYGETSAIMSKVIANGGSLITSACQGGLEYKTSPNILMVKPDRNEIPHLIRSFQTAMTLKPTGYYDPQYSIENCTEHLIIELTTVSKKTSLIKTRGRRYSRMRKVIFVPTSIDSDKPQIKPPLQQAPETSAENKGLVVAYQHLEEELRNSKSYIKQLEQDRQELLAYLKKVEDDRERKIEQISLLKLHLQMLQSPRGTRLLKWFFQIYNRCSVFIHNRTRIRKD